jgi:hypothetical protein
MNARKAIIALIIAILFVSPIAATIFCYNGKVNVNNSKIASLNNQVAHQNSEIANLTSQITHFNSEVANLSTYLEVSEVRPLILTLFNGALPYDALSINGTVVNTGNLTAYNAGLKVTAYSDSGTLEINMTVPLVAGGLAYYPSDTQFFVSGDYIVYYGIDNATQAYANVENNYFDNSGSLNLGDLGGGQIAQVGIEIIHEGIVVNWTVTPVWINSS